MAYAKNTNVAVSKSRMEIENIITRYGADAFMSGTDSGSGRAFVGFQLQGRQVKFVLDLPRLDEFRMTEKGRRRRDESLVRKAHEQACRSAWRSLALVIKAKLEAVEAGITTFDQEFLANVVVPGGMTIGEKIIPRLDNFSEADLPRLLPEAR